MKKQWSCLLLGAVAFVSHAQSEQAQPKMIVTANRMAESTDKVLAPYTVVTADDIERMQATSILDVLSMQPGINIRTSGGRGTTSYISIRGDASGHALILIDGVRAMSATTGGGSIDTLPASMAERIEIIRGSRAAQYGADAMSGVVNIITRPDAGVERKRLTVGVGNHDYGQGNVSYVHQVSDATQLKVSANAERSHGYNFKPHHPLNHNYGYNTQQILVGLTHQLNAQTEVFGKAIINRGHTEYNIPAYNGVPEYVGKTDLVQQFYSLGGNFESGRYRSELNVSYGIDDSRDRAYDSRYITQRYTFNWLHRYQITQDWRVSGGLDERLDDVGKSSAKFDEDKRTNIGGFAQLAYDDGEYLAELGLRQDHNQRYNNNTTYNIAGGWYYLPHHQVKLSYSTAFKAPSFNQLYDLTYGNSKLKPEKSKNLELGFVGDTLGVGYELNIYRNWYRELIQNDSAFIPHNTAQAHITGAELILTGNTGPIEQKLSYVYQYGENQQHHQLAYVPQHTVKWQMDWPIASWDLHTGLDWTGKRYVKEDNEQQMPSYLTVNVAAGYQVTEKLKLKASVHNLLNRDYETVADYKAPGIETRLNATYDF